MELADLVVGKGDGVEGGWAKGGGEVELEAKFMVVCLGGRLAWWCKGGDGCFGEIASGGEVLDSLSRCSGWVPCRCSSWGFARPAIEDVVCEVCPFAVRGVAEALSHCGVE